MVLPSTYYIGVVQGARILYKATHWPIYFIVGGTTVMTLLLWVVGAVSKCDRESGIVYYCTYGESMMM